MKLLHEVGPRVFFGLGQVIKALKKIHQAYKPLVCIYEELNCIIRLPPDLRKRGRGLGNEDLFFPSLLRKGAIVATYEDCSLKQTDQGQFYEGDHMVRMFWDDVCIFATRNLRRSSCALISWVKLSAPL